MRTLDSAAVGRRGLRAFTYQIVAAGRRCAAGGHARGRCSSARGVGVSGRAALAALRTASTTSIAFCARVAGPAAHAAVRHRRRRHQARRHRARDATSGRPRSSRAGRRRSSFRPSRRTTRLHHASTSTSAAPAPSRRSPCSSRCASSGTTISMATLHNEQEVRAPRHPRGRPRHHRKGRRHHPESGRAGRSRSGRPTACPMEDADRVPVLRERARQARGRGRVAVRERLVPGADSPRPGALRVALCDEHRRPRRVARRSARDAGDWCTTYADLVRC